VSCHAGRVQDQIERAWVGGRPGAHPAEEQDGQAGARENTPVPVASLIIKMRSRGMGRCSKNETCPAKTPMPTAEAECHRDTAETIHKEGNESAIVEGERKVSPASLTPGSQSKVSCPAFCQQVHIPTSAAAAMPPPLIHAAPLSTKGFHRSSSVSHRFGPSVKAGKRPPGPRVY